MAEEKRYISSVKLEGDSIYHIKDTEAHEALEDLLVFEFNYFHFMSGGKPLDVRIAPLSQGRFFDLTHCNNFN